MRFWWTIQEHSGGKEKVRLKLEQSFELNWIISIHFFHFHVYATEAVWSLFNPCSHNCSAGLILFHKTSLHLLHPGLVLNIFNAWSWMLSLVKTMTAGTRLKKRMVLIRILVWTIIGPWMIGFKTKSNEKWTMRDAMMVKETQLDLLTVRCSHFWRDKHIFTLR